MADLIADEKGLSAFLMNLYQEKDALKDNFLTTGKFSSNGKFPVHKAIKLEHRIPVLEKATYFIYLISLFIKLVDKLWFYQVYRGLQFNLGKSGEMIIFGSLLLLSIVFWRQL